MYCRNCGAAMDSNAAVCVKCGVAKNKGNAFCPNCGQPTNPNAAVCVKCGYSLAAAQSGEKSKLVAGLLGIFLGSFGIHNFYLGYTKKAVIQLILGLVLIFTVVGWLAMEAWGFIEGLMILAGKTSTDANGNLLT